MGVERWEKEVGTDFVSHLNACPFFVRISHVPCAQHGHDCKKMSRPVKLLVLTAFMEWF